MIAARVRGVLKSAFTGPPELAKDQKRPENFPALQGADRRPGQPRGGRRQRHPGRSLLGADVSDFFGQQTAMPFSDNGPFVANLIGTLAGGDALIGLRSARPNQRPFEVVNQMQNERGSRVPPERAGAADSTSTTRRSSSAQLRQGERQRPASGAKPVITPRAARRDRRRARGHRRYAPAAARRAARPQPRHLALKTEMQLF